MLVVDDDDAFRERLALSMERRGYRVRQAGTAAQAEKELEAGPVDAAVVDLRMPGESGLRLVGELKAACPAASVVVLTGYGSIASAMEAVRLGATDYLTKPADADQIQAALEGVSAAPASETAPSLDRVEWEYMQRVLADCENNITHAAKVLGIDRRSLQRKLAKYPPRR